MATVLVVTARFSLSRSVAMMRDRLVAVKASRQGNPDFGVVDLKSPDGVWVKRPQ
jgi:hypothetical protein